MTNACIQTCNMSVNSLAMIHSTLMQGVLSYIRNGCLQGPRPDLYQCPVRHQHLLHHCLCGRSSAEEHSPGALEVHQGQLVRPFPIHHFVSPFIPFAYPFHPLALSCFYLPFCRRLMLSSWTIKRSFLSFPSPFGSFLHLPFVVPPFLTAAYLHRNMQSCASQQLAANMHQVCRSSK